MIASSLAPQEFIIGMAFNKPEEVEQYILSDVIDHWVLYDVIEPNEDKVTVVYEKKGDCVLVDRMDEVYAQRKKNREERKRRET